MLPSPPFCGIIQSMNRKPTRSTIVLVCTHCGQEYRVFPSDIKSGKQFCSRKCMVEFSRGPNHPFWKGGRGSFPSGYIWLRTPDGGYITEHRLVMGNALGRALTHNEHVHHVNGICGDNRIENLQLVSPAEHARITAKQVKPGWARRFACCKACGTTAVRHHGNGLCHNCYNRSHA